MAFQFDQLFRKKPAVIAMIHLRATPGSPAFDGNIEAIFQQAWKEARIFQDAGVDALLLENMHDTPYLKRLVGPEVISLMSIIAYQIKQQTALPCGIQILAGANEAALAVAQAAGLDFIRAEGFVYGHLADEGYMDADAATLLRYRKQIGAEHIGILTDIKKKHSAHAITADVSLTETAQTAAFCRSDGLILTGSATGAATYPQDLKAVQSISKLPVLIGSGITIDNMDAYLSADAWIIGSHFKKEGLWHNEVHEESVLKFMKKVNTLRPNQELI